MNVSWNDAQEFVAWLCKRTGKLYRLLSEAEWEYAERAGRDKPFSWGDWGDETGKGLNKGWMEMLGTKGTSPIGLFTPNEFGLYDMHGNVYEWVQDCTEDLCVVRGGTWLGNPLFVMRVTRLVEDRRARLAGLGLRVGRTLNP